MSQAKLDEVLAWLRGTAEPSLAAVERRVDRLARNARCHERLDYPAAPAAPTSPDASVAQPLMDRVCTLARRLKMVHDVTRVAHTAAEAPAFLVAQPVRLSVPPSMGTASLTDDEVKAIFSQLLYGFLLKLWAPLRYAEDLVHSLNAYCAQLPELARDVAGVAVPADANAAASAVADQLRRLDSNVSRIEAFVMVKHNLPDATSVQELVQLKSDLALGALTEAEYRVKKDAVLDALLAFNATKFRPTPYHLLATPAQSARASIAPRVVHDRSLETVLSESLRAAAAASPKAAVPGTPAAVAVKTAPARGSPLTSDVSIDELMALTVAPVTPARPKERATVTFGAEQKARLAEFEALRQRELSPQPRTSPDGAATSVRLFGMSSDPERMASEVVSSQQWESDNLVAPVFDDSVVVASPNARHTVSFEPQQMAKLQALERMRAQLSPQGGGGAPAVQVATPAQPVPSAAVAHDREHMAASSPMLPRVSAAAAEAAKAVATLSASTSPRPKSHREAFFKQLDLPRKGSLTIQVDLASTAVAGNSILWLPITVINQARSVRVEGLELVLRDPVFNKVLSVANCVERWAGDTFPLKFGVAHVRYPLTLPFLPPVSQRSRYTLTLTPMGRGLSKKDSFTLSVPLAVVEAHRLHEHCPTQVFGTPLDVLAEREGTAMPRVVSEVLAYFARAPLKQAWQMSTDVELLSWLRAQYDAGDWDVLQRNTVDAFAVGTLLYQYLWALPEAIVPAKCWVAFRDTAHLATPEARTAAMRVLVAELPEARRGLLDAVVRFLAGLVASGTLVTAAEMFGAALARPPDRTPDALAVGESTDSSAIAHVLLEVAAK